MRTILSCFGTTLWPVVASLESLKKLELVYVISEENYPDNPAHISRLPFLTFEYDEKTLNLIKKYKEDFPFDQDVYKKMYPNMYRYICNISRHNKDFQDASDTDFLHSFNLMYQFLYSLLVKEKIELVIFDHVPHAGFDDILYDLCKILHIRTIILMSCCSPLTNQPFLQYAFQKEDCFSFNNMRKKYREVNEKLNDSFQFNHYYMQNIVSGHFSVWKIRYVLGLLKQAYKQGRINRILNLSHKKIARKYPLYVQFKRDQKKYTVAPDFSSKFVYFPLHLQPEVTTSFNGGIYCDQILAIERLSTLIPKDWYIYVKENPKQNEYMRGPLFFKRLHLVPQVRYIDKSVPSAQLLKHCQFCASIDGTASFESICGGKPTLIFGRVWWDFLPGVFKYTADFDVQEILRYRIDAQKLIDMYNEYLGRTVYASTYPASEFSTVCPEFTEEVNGKNLFELLTSLLEEVKKPTFPLGN